MRAILAIRLFMRARRSCTDGKQNDELGGDKAAIDAVREANAAGIDVFAVGIGTTVKVRERASAIRYWIALARACAR